MAPSRRKGAAGKAAAAAAARRQWKVGDLVLAKVKGFPAWPATVRFSLYFWLHVTLFSDALFATFKFFCVPKLSISCLLSGVIVDAR
jgi:hypothetical protein